MGGLLGGLSSVLVCHPLEITKTRLNLQMSISNFKIYSSVSDCFRTILKEERVKGFYKGLNVTLVSVPIFNSIFFTLYNIFQTKMTENYSSMNKNAINLVSSLTAGGITNIITNPLWMVRIRL